MTIEAALSRLGLNRQESEVYLNTLKLGVAKASEIAQKSKIKRESCYYVLKLLQEKGFISEVIRSGVKHYSAANPKAILNLVDEEYREKKEAIKDALPELESLQKIALTRPSIEVYEGVDGFRTITAKMVERENQIICAYVPESILHFLPTFHAQFRRRRKEMNVRMKLITENTKFMIDAKSNDKEELRETRFRNDIMKGAESAYFVLDDSVIMIKANEKEQVGTHIRDENTARLQKKIFEQLWKDSDANVS